MGVDYTAFTVIGIEIDYNKIPRTETKTKIGNHNFPESINFNPNTGEALWKVESKPKFTIDDNADGEDNYIKPPERLRTISGTYYQEETSTFFGYVIESEGEVFTKLPNIEKLEKEIREFLEPLNLWDKKQFGIYTILYCSY